MDIQKGDKCWVYIGAVTKHYGVCVGHDSHGQPRFIHNTARHGRVTYATLPTSPAGSRCVSSFGRCRAEPMRSFVAPSSTSARRTT